MSLRAIFFATSLAAAFLATDAQASEPTPSYATVGFWVDACTRTISSGNKTETLAQAIDFGFCYGYIRGIVSAAKLREVTSSRRLLAIS